MHRSCSAIPYDTLWHTKELSVMLIAKRFSAQRAHNSYKTQKDVNISVHYIFSYVRCAENEEYEHNATE